MPTLELSFASGEDSLSVRRFVVEERMSALFTIAVWARSPNEDINLQAIVGEPASFRVAADGARLQRDARVFTGICSFMEQEQAEETGLSTYHLHIVPALWLLTKRRNHRVFQHLTAPEIVRRMLDEWGLEAAFHIQHERYPKLEYRVQYGESDFAFLSRILEEAGISFFFSEEAGKGSLLVLTDAPHVVESGVRGPIRYVDHPTRGAEREFVTKVRVSREVRSTKVIVRDHDFRRRVDVPLAGEARAPSGDAKLEQLYFRPGAFLVEGPKGSDTPVADGQGVVRADEKVGRGIAEAILAVEEGERSRISFHTNVVDLRPGVVFSIANHPRADLDPDKALLVTELSMEGTHDGEWAVAGKAVFAAHAYRPARVTEKPRIHSVESAIVVGPRGEEIYTDEYGRVRVQFHWDREGIFDERSSCWMRVSQGWAGGGFGVMMLPRVGQEVLVGFLAGDPDQPVVVGRVYNNTARVPYKLPESKTISTWKSDSSPGSDGFNEIMFEDAKGAELVYVQAERNLEKLVKVDEAVTIGHNREKHVGSDESIEIGGSRTATIGVVDAKLVGARHAVTMRQAEGALIPPTGTEMVDRRITLTTGEASITLEGPNITLAAAAEILLNAAADITIRGKANITVMAGAAITVDAAGGDVVIQGGPLVQINPKDRTSSRPELPVELPPDMDIDEALGEAEDHAWFDRAAPDWFRKKLMSGDWDFAARGERYRDFEGFHVGMVGGALGLPEGVVLRQVGMKRKARGESKAEWGDPGNGMWGGKEPYGLAPREHEMIRQGFGFYGKNYR